MSMHLATRHTPSMTGQVQLAVNYRRQLNLATFRAVASKLVELAMSYGYTNIKNPTYQSVVMCNMNNLCYCLSRLLHTYLSRYDNYHDIKTHDSELRGQEEAGRTRRTSELFTCSTALNFVNALNKPP